MSAVFTLLSIKTRIETKNAIVNTQFALSFYSTIH